MQGILQKRSPSFGSQQTMQAFRTEIRAVLRRHSPGDLLLNSDKFFQNLFKVGPHYPVTTRLPPSCDRLSDLGLRPRFFFAT